MKKSNLFFIGIGIFILIYALLIILTGIFPEIGNSGQVTVSLFNGGMKLIVFGIVLLCTVIIICTIVIVDAITRISSKS